MKKRPWMLLSSLPPARRQGLAIALSSLLVAGALAASRWPGGDGPEERLRYISARYPLEAGHKLDVRQFALRGADSVPSGTIREDQWEGVAGKVLARGLRPGDWLRWEDLEEPVRQPFGSRIPRGKRAYPLRPRNRLPLASNDRVDVFLTPRDPGRAPFPVVEAVQVLRAADGPTGWEVVIAAEPRQVPLLEKARQQGTLSIALRNPREPAEGPATARPPVPPKQRVIIWTEEPQ